MNVCIYITFLCEPFCTGIKCVGCSKSDENLNGCPSFAFSWAPTVGDLGMQHEGVKCNTYLSKLVAFACCEERVCTSQ